MHKVLLQSEETTFGSSQSASVRFSSHPACVVPTKSYTNITDYCRTESSNGAEPS